MSCKHSCVLQAHQSVIVWKSPCVRVHCLAQRGHDKRVSSIELAALDQQLVKAADRLGFYAAGCLWVACVERRSNAAAIAAGEAVVDT